MSTYSPYLKVILALVAIKLGLMIVAPLQSLPVVQAQSDYSHYFIEPGTTVIRDPGNGQQVQGKVVIDRRNGDVWGFPTASSAPFPVVVYSKEPPVSKPVYLGRFDFASMIKK